MKPLITRQPMYHIRRLQPEDAPAFRQLRLAALRDTPSAFTTSLSTEESMPAVQQLQRIAGASCNAIWGAFDSSEQLLGSAALLHQTMDKVRHKATIYAVYVAPDARGAGLSRQLVEAVIAHARAQPELTILQLSVTGSNAQAHQLYLRLGFIEYGREPHAIVTSQGHHDQILMWMPLRDKLA